MAVDLDNKRFNSKQKLNTNKCQCEQHVCEEEYSLNLCIWACVKLINIQIIALA